MSPRATSRDYWLNMARQWDLLGAPLRPSVEDLCFYQEAIELLGGSKRSLRALILGVTPELFHLAWPQQTEVSAVDRTQGMIDLIWPGPRDAAICGDWCDMPFETASRDVVLCDGGAITLPYPQGLEQLARELHRVLVPCGLCVIRTFVRPPCREKTAEVLNDLWAGNVPNTNVLKLRLGMALQDDVREGVTLAEIWNTLHRAAPDLNRLAKQIGWEPEPLLAINAYRDCPNRYSFHSMDEFLSRFVEQPGGFTTNAIRVPHYALGDRCPTVVLRRDDFEHTEAAGDARIMTVHPPHTSPQPLGVLNESSFRIHLP